MFIQALSMPYLLHPINRSGNEEVTYHLPLLLVVGIAVAGEHLIVGRDCFDARTLILCPFNSTRTQDFCIRFK